MMRKTDVACATTSGELLYDTIFKVVKVDTPRPLTPNKMLLEMDPSVAIESLPKVRVRASLLYDRYVCTQKRPLNWTDSRL